MKNLIKNMFHDNREMKKINKLHNVFETNDNEIVALRLHLGDFTPESLADYTEGYFDHFFGDICENLALRVIISDKCIQDAVDLSFVKKASALNETDRPEPVHNDRGRYPSKGAECIDYQIVIVCDTERQFEILCEFFQLFL